jgi:hypothetical protein
MVLSTKIKVTLIFVLLIILVYFQTQYTRQKLTHSPVISSPKRFCSFDDIAACQISSITNRTFLYIAYDDAGFGSELNQLLLAFAYSVTTKRQFLINDGHWNYGHFIDYFNLPSSNNYSQFNYTFLTENNHENESIDHLQISRYGTPIDEFWRATQQVQSIAIKRRVAHYLWKSMSNETFKFIQTYRIRSLSNYIGIHIRKGDKIKTEAHEIPLEKYVTAIERILKANKTIKHIFVASDDYRVVEQLRQLKPKWNFLSLHDHNSQRKKTIGHFQHDFNRLSKEQKLNETRLLMCELQILMDSQYVVCGMSSNICRLVQILRHQDPSTVISLDGSWHGA